MRIPPFIITLLAITYFTASTAKAQDTMHLHHSAYDSYYAMSAHIPVLVTYTLHSGQLSCRDAINRKGYTFKADADADINLSKDYKGSGYDEGHNMPAQDNACAPGDMKDCFLFTNCFPQTHNLNAGAWLQLENKERENAEKQDSIIVFIGSFGCGKTIGPDKVFVPSYCWKVIYFPGAAQWETHIYTNETTAAETEITDAQKAWIKHCIDHFTKYKYQWKNC